MANLPLHAIATRWSSPAILAGTTIVATALLGVDTVVKSASIALEALFIAYFLRHLVFAVSALDASRRPVVTEPLVSGLPRVSVMVACHNEGNVAADLVRHLRDIDYPRDRIEFVLIDDRSTDGTRVVLDKACERDQRFRCVHRSAMDVGGKSAALNDGLRVAGGEIVVVFDADHQPRPDVVRKLVRHFRDPAVAAVQGRCVIGNPGDSLLARLVWIDYLGGYLVNEFGRQSVFALPAYGGANCAVRMSSLRDVGGWNEASVTEDTDLTLRLLLAGWRVRYDNEAIDVEEGVLSLDRYWHQRYRWARGHQEVCRRYRRAVWRSPHLGPIDKVELTMFLYAFHVPVATAFGLGLFALWVTGIAQPLGQDFSFVFWTLLFLGPLLELGSGMLLARVPRREVRSLVFFLPLVFVAIALCTKAWWDGARREPYAWHKTARRREPVRAAA